MEYTIETNNTTVKLSTIDNITFEAPPVKSQYEEEIKELKQKLCDTDYEAIKFAEGAISLDDYSELKSNRQSWRDRINELESLISSL